MSQIKSVFIICILVSFFICSAFFFPRWLVACFGEGHFISSYLYIYGSGIPFFILGVWLLIRSRALDFRIKGEKKWLWFFVLGLTWYLIAHGLWILAAISFPFTGVLN